MCASRMATTPRRFAALWLVMLLAGCGFHMRGTAKLPFDTIYVPSNGGVGLQIRRYIQAGTSAQVVDNPKQAQAVLQITQEAQNKQIASLDANGRVSAYRLLYTLGFNVIDKKGGYYIAPTTLRLSRYMTYSDAEALAKEEEETLIYREMRSDAVQRVLLMLAEVKAPAAVAH